MWVVLPFLFFGGVAWGCGGAELVAVARPEPEKHAVQILIEKCGACHGGPFLDLRTFPFRWDRSASLEALMQANWERIQRPSYGRMPPVNAPSLTAREREIIRDWIAAGLPSP